MGSMMKVAVTVVAGIILGAVLMFGGCVEGLRGLGLRFPHKDHVSEVTCTDCHKDGLRARHDACVNCHEIEESAPSEKCHTCHTDASCQVRSERPSSYKDVMFDHGAHESETCERCHAGVKGSGKASDSHVPGMDVCMTCHDGEEGSSECSTCHKEVRRDAAPKSHHLGWETTHGREAKTDKSSCGYCHKETSCEDCHTTRRPMSHSAGWKNSGHGIAADYDRRRCVTCHRADECSRCHRIRPASHFGARFRNPLNENEGHVGLAKRRGGSRSCKVCHQTDNTCFICHREVF